MLEAIEGLLVLQDRDRLIADLNDRITKIPTDETRARSRLDTDQKAVNDAREALQQNEIEAKNLELEVETRRNTVSRLKTQQFETRKNDEYQALAHEIERYNAEIDRMETRQLEFMEKTDRLREDVREAEDRLAKTREIVNADLAELETRRENLERELAEVREKRGQLAADVAEPDVVLLDLYDRLRKKKGLAIVPVENGQCGGCHVKLIPGTLVEVQGEKGVTQCENCGRILYMT